MRHPLELLFPPELGVEMLYSFVIIICSLMIYYSTKEIYELSSYKGIKYFRQSFLFFAIAYFFRYFIVFFMAFFNIQGMLGLSPREVLNVSMMIFLYSSSMAVFYLVYSVMWKKWNHSRLRIYLFNLLAIVIAFMGILFRSMEMSLLLNLILFLFVAFVLTVAYNDSKDKKKGKGLLVIYLFLFIFFFLNIVDILIPKFLQFYKMGIYLASVFLFMAILYKVLKKIGN